MNEDEAQGLAIRGLGWIAGDAELFSRFCALSGVEPASIRLAAQEPGFLAGVLRFIASHEPTLRRFADEEGVDVTSVLPAIRMLPGGDDAFDRSI